MLIGKTSKLTILPVNKLVHEMTRKILCVVLITIVYVVIKVYLNVLSFKTTTVSLNLKTIDMQISNVLWVI